MRIHIYGSDDDGEESGRLASKFASRQPGLKSGQAAFVDIHYHGKDAELLRANPALSATPALTKGGQTALVDIHYHGKDAGMLGANPALAGNPALSKGGQAAFLDIHYHGKDGMERLGGGGFAPEASEEGGGLMSSSSVVTNALRGRPLAPAPGVSQPGIKGGGSAAFLDIHYHGSDAGMVKGNPTGVDLQTRVPGGLGQVGGTQAFVDIHYHGKQISPAEVSGKPGLHVGDAAFLDIHYHG